VVVVTINDHVTMFLLFVPRVISISDIGVNRP
jgi:hypothetical protein